ncbi:DNA-binding protein [Actinomycetospora cinnamomea]|uniref:LytTr DNA-binding domain-containing protein n=1 Tax=Actinomycetospora cinnamomea TaxID=663609 RepID=A0A2U1FSA0_9PSEU|nr:DNA-binding protein [Actinomycetospora cinnamomea]PVZ15028.1 LytTr DNA-binding domain-containing protein [Actinomycetospora cinnamomea]
MDTSAPPSRSFDRAFSRTYAAWERFASGSGDASGVPRSIALSWHRCRDVYRIDPTTAQAEAVRGAPAGPVHGRVLAELGALAASFMAGAENRLVAVSDGAGAVLAAWGSGPAGRRAPDTGFFPTMRWSEAVTGTNAIGTTIVQRRVCSVCGPEHWSTVLHPWSCTGVAVPDPVTAAPLATLTVASWREMVSVRPRDLLLATEPLVTALHEAAARHRRLIAEAFVDLDRRSSGAVVALDLSGRVVAANDAARRRGAVPGEHAVERPVTSRHDIRSLGHLVHEVRERVREDPGWQGTVSLWSALTADDETYRVVPVVAGADPIAFLACTDARVGAGDPLDRLVATPDRPRHPAPRVPALGAGGQLVVLHPSEVRYARSDGHAVWLVTDHGPMRATTRGIDQVEHELSPLGFLRVHRSYLVNVGRVRDIASVKDRLVLSTAPGEDERIPVSRRYVPVVRHALGL